MRDGGNADRPRLLRTSERFDQTFLTTVLKATLVKEMLPVGLVEPPERLDPLLRT